MILVGLLLGFGDFVTVGFFAFRPAAEERPQANFLPPIERASETHLILAALSRPLPQTDFLVRLSKGIDDGVTAIPGDMGTGSSGRVLGRHGGYGIFWRDSGSRGRLDAGDAFVVTYLHWTSCPFDPAVLSLLWHDHSPIASIQFRWNCTATVGVSFGMPYSRFNGTFLPIGSIADAALWMHFQVRIRVAGGVTEPAWMDEPASFVVPGYPSSFHIQPVDTDFSGTVSRGDALFVSLPPDERAGTALSLDLLWRDGTSLAAASWTS